jgi:hypothetical protein
VSFPKCTPQVFAIGLGLDSLEQKMGWRDNQLSPFRFDATVQLAKSSALKVKALAEYSLFYLRRQRW